jgi:aldehyde dehydrogenase
VIWGRDMNRLYRFGRAIRPVACGPTAITPIRAPRRSAAQAVGIGRENHKMMLDHYQQMKNMLVSYSPKKLGFLMPTGLGDA